MEVSRIKRNRYGNATLYRGDCLKIAATLQKVDHIITDPPYDSECHKTLCRTQKSITNKTVDILDFVAFTESDRKLFVAETLRLADKWILSFCQVEAAGKYQDLFGKMYKRTMVWVKPDAAPQFTGDKPAQGYECMSLAWAGKGKSVWNGGGKRGVFSYNTNSASRTGQHQTEKPLKLMKKLIELFTNPGDTILDMYMGSGTTGVAALQLNRKFIGIEIDPEKYKFACSRIEDAVAATGKHIKANPVGFLY